MENGTCLIHKYIIIALAAYITNSLVQSVSRKLDCHMPGQKISCVF